MSIKFDKQNKIFNLQTANTSYMFAVVQNKYLFHVHYGKKVNTVPDIEEYAKQFNANYMVVEAESNSIQCDCLPLEFSTFGNSDFKTPTFHAKYADGSTNTRLYYDGHKIYKGKPLLKGLPATYVESDDDATTLEVYLRDKYNGLKATLLYTVFENIDAITRSIRYENESENDIHILSALSSTVDFNDNNFEIMSLSGSWARERHIEKTPLTHSKIEISSNRGTTSHIQNNFFTLSRLGSTETTGDVYGFSLVYSGNFNGGVDVSSQDITRAYLGISSFNFDWKLSKGEIFQTPEVVHVYSDEGFGKMSRIYHDLYRKNLCGGKYRDIERPVLINNWEATYFDFDEEKIVNIAKKAKSAGIDLMVLDDGWFGKRNDDFTSLGDWFVDENKLPKGISSLAEKVNEMGMQFGLWFEPEMISERSQLYEKHPDWHLHLRGRTPNLGRNQLVLDLSRQDVCDYVVNAVCDILSSAKISYVKWDMNRYLSDVYSISFSFDQQGEIWHRFTLGVYQIMDRITSAFPDVLFEGCSGGGGRFDPGILYYSPQIWASDDTDAIERMYIQHGTSMVYPASSMGAHVSAVPNHQVGRTTPISLRGNVAMAGQFGYELDLNKLSEEEFNEVKAQIEFYRNIRETVHQGDMFRIRSPFDNSSQDTAWQYISKDKKQIVLFDFTMRGKANAVLDHVKLQGLDENAIYVEQLSGKEFGGDMLMNIGIPIRHEKDYQSNVFVFNVK